MVFQRYVSRMCKGLSSKLQQSCGLLCFSPSVLWANIHSTAQNHFSLGWRSRGCCPNSHRVPVDLLSLVLASWVVWKKKKSVWDICILHWVSFQLDRLHAPAEWASTLVLDQTMGMGRGGTVDYSGIPTLYGDGVVLFLLFLPLHELFHECFRKPLDQKFCHLKEKANSSFVWNGSELSGDSGVFSGLFRLC